MAEVLPYLQLGAREIDCIRQELLPCIETWGAQWSTVALDTEWERVDLESLTTGAYAARWGSGHFWIGSETTDSFNALLSLACFQEVYSVSTHALALNVFSTARDSLLALLLNQERAAPHVAAIPPMRGKSLRLRVYSAACDFRLILSPSLLADILENRFYRVPESRFQRIERALAHVPVHLTAVVGAATVSLADFMSLEAGDVVGLDPAQRACLADQQGPIAWVTPCRQKTSLAVRVETFLTDRKIP